MRMSNDLRRPELCKSQYLNQYLGIFRLFTINLFLERCKPDVFDDDRGTTYWRSASVNEMVRVLCPYGDFERMAERYCLFDLGSQRASWAYADLTHCRTKVSFWIKYKRIKFQKIFMSEKFCRIYCTLINHL